MKDKEIEDMKQEECLKVIIYKSQKYEDIQGKEQGKQEALLKMGKITKNQLKRGIEMGRELEIKENSKIFPDIKICKGHGIDYIGKCWKCQDEMFGVKMTDEEIVDKFWKEWQGDKSDYDKYDMDNWEFVEETFLKGIQQGIELERKKQEEILDRDIEILRYAGCLDDVDDDVSKLALSLIPRKDNEKISLADLTIGIQNIKNSFKQKLQNNAEQ